MPKQYIFDQKEEMRLNALKRTDEASSASLLMMPWQRDCVGVYWFDWRHTSKRSTVGPFLCISAEISLILRYRQKLMPEHVVLKIIGWHESYALSNFFKRQCNVKHSSYKSREISLPESLTCCNPVVSDCLNRVSLLPAIVPVSWWPTSGFFTIYLHRNDTHKFRLRNTFF